MNTERIINPGARRGLPTPADLASPRPVIDMVEFGRRTAPPLAPEASVVTVMANDLPPIKKRPTPQLDELAELDEIAQVLLSRTFGAFVKYTQGVEAEHDPSLPNNSLDARTYRWAMRHLSPPAVPQQSTTTKTDQGSTAP